MALSQSSSHPAHPAHRLVSTSTWTTSTTATTSYKWVSDNAWRQHRHRQNTHHALTMTHKTRNKQQQRWHRHHSKLPKPPHSKGKNEWTRLIAFNATETYQTIWWPRNGRKPSCQLSPRRRMGITSVGSPVPQHKAVAIVSYSLMAAVMVLVKATIYCTYGQCGIISVYQQICLNWLMPTAVTCVTTSAVSILTIPFLKRGGTTREGMYVYTLSMGHSCVRTSMKRLHAYILTASSSGREWDCLAATEWKVLLLPDSLVFAICLYIFVWETSQSYVHTTTVSGHKSLFVCKFELHQD